MPVSAADPDDLERRLAEADAALARGDRERARRLFEVLTLDFPRLAPAWDGLARCHAADGALDRAAPCFRRAAALDGGAWAPRLHFGLALEQSGRTGEALRWLRAAARVAPRERRVLRELARCEALAGAPEDALRTLRRALRAPEGDVPDADLHLAVARLQSQRGELAAAEEACGQAGLLRPNDPEILYQWALLAARSGDAALADRLAARVQSLEPGGLRGRLLRVRLAWDAGDWDAAAALVAPPSGEPGLEAAVTAETDRRRGRRKEARAAALAALAEGAGPTAADLALETLRELRAMRGAARGFRLVVETDGGDWTAYRPCVVLAEDADQARWFLGEVLEAADPHPTVVVEEESFPAATDSLLGVYQLGPLSRRFPRGP